MKRRILITHRVGNAWKKLCEPAYDHFRRRCWEKTGCLITADGSEDDKISPEGLRNYHVPPPLEFLPATTVLPEPNNTIGTDDEQAPTMTDAIEEMEDETPTDTGKIFIDHEDEETFVHCTRRGGTRGKLIITINLHASIMDQG